MATAMLQDRLSDIVNRAKARWLKRAMYSSAIGSTPKTLAFAIADHLNCVTLDAWPSQAKLAGLLGFACDKTIQRCARALVRADLISLSSQAKQTAGHRYAPVFIHSDWDRSARSDRQKPVMSALGHNQKYS
jgi:hypothetical protein